MGHDERMAEMYERLRGHVTRSLAGGEPLHGVLLATQQSLFKGRMVALGVTPERLVLQPLTRKFDADGSPTVLHYGDVTRAELDGAAGGWITPTAALMDRAAGRLELRTASGDKFRLMMMHGEGLLGGLGGGERQQEGVEALVGWLGRWEAAQSG